MRSAKALNEDTKSGIRTRIRNFGRLSGNDRDCIGAWVSRSGLILAGQQNAVGIDATPSALPSVDILLNLEACPTLLPIQDERASATCFDRIVRRQLSHYKVCLNIVGFVSPAYLELDSVTPYTCDWQHTQSGSPLITDVEWYRTWK